jgi:phage terminase large subunit-like protein
VPGDGDHVTRPVEARWLRDPSDTLAIDERCHFDEDAGRFACEFIETFCRQSTGKWAGKPLQLLDWQRDYLMRLFGWRRADGKRRYRTSYLEVAKKNGKSTLVAALAVYLLLADGEGSPEVHLNAVDRDQASIVFNEAKRMVEQSPELAGRLEVIDSRKRIVDPRGRGVIRANSADVASKDGVNASAVIFDELHRQKSREMWDVFSYASVARDQPLRIAITTAGEEESGPWFEQRDYSEKIITGIIPDTSHLGVIYRALPTDDVEDPATWRKANPSMGVTIREEDFGRELREARPDAARWANFARLRLNLVSRGDVAFIDLEAWDACSAPPLESSGAPIHAGLDLSDTDDLTALCWITGDAEAGYDVRWKFWLPEANIVALERKHQVPYRTWADRGFIDLTPGNVVDYSHIRRAINDLAADRGLAALLVDPYNATGLSIELKEQDGLPVETIRQGYLSLSAPTKELRRLIRAVRIRHGGHPIARWHAGNAVAEQDAAGNIKLSKRKSRRKIDGMAALVNAVAALEATPEGGRSIYETERLLIL